MNKYSFKISWLDQEEQFLVKLLCNGEVVEENKFPFHHYAFEYISETMAGLMLAGEEWTLTYK